MNPLPSPTDPTFFDALMDIVDDILPPSPRPSLPTLAARSKPQIPSNSPLPANCEKIRSISFSENSPFVPYNNRQQTPARNRPPINYDAWLVFPKNPNAPRPSNKPGIPNLGQQRLFLCSYMYLDNPSSYKNPYYSTATVKSLGKGAYGTVFSYSCYPVENKGPSQVVVKRVNTCKEEFETLCKLNGVVPHVVRLRSSDTRDGLVMEEVEPVLSQRKTPMTPHEVKIFIYQMAQFLEAMEKRKLIHFDLHPGNLSFSLKRGGQGGLKVIDFGSCCPCGKNQKPLCKNSIAPPEAFLFNQSYTPAVDMWCFGITLCKVAFGKDLFEDGSPIGDKDYLNLTDPNLFRIQRFQKIYQICQSVPTSAMLQSSRVPDVYKKNLLDRCFRYDPSFTDPRVSLLPSLTENLTLTPLPVLLEPKTKDDEELVHLISQMLVVDPTKRITPSELLRHPFLAEFSRGQRDLDDYKG